MKLSNDGKTLIEGYNVSHFVIPHGVEKVGKRAFEGCRSLKYVVIPNSVTTIWAFYGCRSLESVEITDGGNSIERCALKSVTIPNSVTTIDEGAFSHCTALKSVYIPNSVTYIGDGAFYGCDLLKSVEVPDDVTEIGEDAFYDCPSLSSVEVPSVAKIWKGAFTETTEVLRKKIGCEKCVLV